MITHSVWGYTFELASELAKHCDLTVVGSHRRWSEEWLRRPPFRIVRLPSAARSSKLGRGARWALGCYRLVRELRPDLLHVQIGNPATLLALRATRVPMVVTMHDPSPHLGEDRLAQRASHRMTLALGDWFVAHGPAAVKTLRSQSIEASRIFVHDHGPLSMFGRPEGYRPSRGRTVLFFGRIHAYKGLEFLVRAVDGLERPAELVVAGRGDRAYLDRCLAGAGRKPTLHWGHIAGECVTRLFDEATVVCVPYVDASQSGVAAIAKATGRAVIATTSGDLPVAIQEPRFGLVVTPRSVGELADALERLLGDEPTRHAMERRALEYTASAPWRDIAQRLYRQYLFWLDERQGKS